MANLLHLYPLLSLIWASPVTQMVKNLPVMQETWVQSLSQEDALEKGVVTHLVFLVNSMVREAWQATGVHGVTKSQT